MTSQAAQSDSVTTASSTSERLVDQLSNKIGGLGVELADVAGNVQEVASRVSTQSEHFAHLQKTAETMVSANHDIADASLRAKNAGAGASQIQGIIARVQTGVTKVGQEIDGVTRAATSNLAHCDEVIGELAHLAKGVDLSSSDLKKADERVARLLETSEGLIALIADSGVETSDAPLIRTVINTAKQIADIFEAGIARGEVTLDQLMDEKYREIAGTDPKQFMTAYVEFTDRVLPAIQDPIQKSDPRIVFCVAWAKGGYLPTHNPNYRLPQGKDPVWNNANCRNRRLFTDRAVKKVAANTRPFLLQTYRRDMGGGNFVLMKDLSSPIFVRGRHWGAFRMGFREI